MDSGSNSGCGSIQSSSGGDDDCNNKRTTEAEGISRFLQNHSSTSSMFDPFSNFFDPLPTRNSPIDLGMVFPDNIPTSDTGFVPISSTLNPKLQTKPFNTKNTNTNNSGNGNGRNPRKRTRASRRAPTTVLTTDTSNFRAMVQEFTGIPSPPFSPAVFPRPRLDLFGNVSVSSSPPYLLRPFPQKLSHFTSPTITATTTTTSVFQLPNSNNNNIVGSKLQHVSDHRNPRLQMGVLEDFSLSQGLGHGAEITWGIGGGGVLSEQALFRSMNGNGKMNFSASSDFHEDINKGSENNVTTRGEDACNNFSQEKKLQEEEEEEGSYLMSRGI